MPPLENPSSKILPTTVADTLEDGQLEEKVPANQEDTAGQCVAVLVHQLEQRLKAGNLDDVVVEPKTGFKFPVLLSSAGCQEGSGSASGSQVLAGVGARSITIIKLTSIKIYAFGFYIEPECMRAQLGEKYSTVPPGELNHKSTFYEDLLRHDLEMTVRLVVHYKRMKIGMVRSAFETSLRNRLRKIKGVDDDEGLRVFCSYFTEELSLPPGTVIDFRWQRGGKLRTEIDGRLIGTIFSLDLCRAFFDLYIGDPPVSSKAKQDIGEKLLHMLRMS